MARPFVPRLVDWHPFPRSTGAESASLGLPPVGVGGQPSAGSRAAPVAVGLAAGLGWGLRLQGWLAGPGLPVDSAPTIAPPGSLTSIVDSVNTCQSFNLGGRAGGRCKSAGSHVLAALQPEQAASVGDHSLAPANSQAFKWFSATPLKHSIVLTAALPLPLCPALPPCPGPHPAPPPCPLPPGARSSWAPSTLER